jgi:hypothetical protein
VDQGGGGLGPTRMEISITHHSADGNPSRISLCHNGITGQNLNMLIRVFVPFLNGPKISGAMTSLIRKRMISGIVTMRRTRRIPNAMSLIWIEIRNANDALPRA